MNVLIFGATGMLGQAVLRECLLDPAVTLVKTIGRNPTADQHPKLQQLRHPDLWHYDSIEAELAPFDACFFCLGVSAAGMTEAEYSHTTFDMTLAAATTLARLNPQMTFVYVSGAGCDSTEKGSVMWARVKGKTENALLALPFKAAYMFRPGAIQPLHGVKSKTKAYRLLYSATKPLWPLLRRWFPNQVLTSEQIGLAMLKVAKQGAPKRLLESADLNAL
jgi:uncharacterized protein YbjT (DUF2867 family)